MQDAADSEHSQDQGISSNAADSSSIRANPDAPAHQAQTRSVPLQRVSRLARQLDGSNAKPIEDHDAAAAADEAGLNQGEASWESEPEPDNKSIRPGHKRKRQAQRYPPLTASRGAGRTASAGKSGGQNDSTSISPQPRRGRGRGRGRGSSRPNLAAASAVLQQSDHVTEAEQSSSVRRTGRQRRLTPAAAAAVEDFPSLYRQPKHAESPPVRSSTPSDCVATSEDASAGTGATPSSSRDAKRNQGKPGKAQIASAAGFNHVQMRQLVRFGVLPAGSHEFLFDGKHTCDVEVLPDGMPLLRDAASVADMHAVCRVPAYEPPPCV